jgi:DNA repair protein RecO (recombination protein O)
VYFQSHSIIIKNTDYREKDKLVTVFSEKQGKHKAIARGIKKPGSSLRASVQPFCSSLLFFSSGRELDLITQGRLIDFFANSREDINRTLYSVYIMELLDKALMDRVPMPQLFGITLSVLEFINNQGINPLILRYFEMQLIVELGFKPELNYCTNCGQRISTYKGFSLANGGMICARCASEDDKCIVLAGEVIGLLRLLIDGEINTLQRVRATTPALHQLELFLGRYLEYHLERHFNLKSTISKIDKGRSAW